ncbi:MAG TPA: hypothetical protein DCM14_01465 [Clostridiales bacterium UBA8153]|nr:hypothetical protein [Clostridiales bacterium UBA8153]
MVGAGGSALVDLHPDALSGPGLSPGHPGVVSSPRWALWGRARPRAVGREDGVMACEGKAGS